MDVEPKIGGKPPKWIKPYEQMDDLGVPLFLEIPIYALTEVMGWRSLMIFQKNTLYLQEFAGGVFLWIKTNQEDFYTKKVEVHPNLQVTY